MDFGEELGRWFKHGQKIELKHQEEKRQNNWDKHICVMCPFRGFKELNCSIDVVGFSEDGTICKAVEDYPTPNVCPTSLNQRVIMIDDRPITSNGDCFKNERLGESNE